jgi:hypothetical protein
MADKRALWPNSHVADGEPSRPKIEGPASSGNLDGN